MAYSYLLGIDIPNIRTTQHNKQTHYSVIDIFEAVTGSKVHPYWHEFKRKNPWTDEVVIKLDMPCRGLRQLPTDCANAEGILLILATFVKGDKALPIIRFMAKAASDKLKQTKETSLVKFIESIE